MNIADATAIIISICSVISVIIAYKTLKANLKKQASITDSMIASIANKQSQGNTFQNCNITYTGNVKDENTINNEYKKYE